MSKDPKNYSLEEKTRICLEVTSADESALQEVLQKYQLSYETVELWMGETGVSDQESGALSGGAGSDIYVEMDNETAKSTRFGASYDTLNYKRLTFWAIFGSTVILVMVLSIIFIYEFSFSGMDSQQSVQNDYFDIQVLNEADAKRLNSFGVVDEEQGIYHVPIDSAIQKMIEP